MRTLRSTLGSSRRRHYANIEDLHGPDVEHYLGHHGLLITSKGRFVLRRQLVTNIGGRNHIRMTENMLED